jgi:hypothetical protein
MAWQIADTVDLEMAAWSPGAVTKTNALESLVIASFVRGLSVRDVEAPLPRWLPNSLEANFPVVPRSFGLDSVTGPAVVLTVTSRYPFREPGRASSLAAARW